MNRLFILLSFICYLESCHSIPPQDKNITYINSEDLQKISSFDPTSLIDSCTYIALETNDSLLLGEGSKVMPTDKYLFVLNNSTNNFFVFDRQGKFLHKIGSAGRGPKEYQWLSTFCIISQDTILLYDEPLHRLQFYTSNNQYIRTIDLHKHLHRDSNVFRGIQEICYLEPGKLLIGYHMMHLCSVAYSVYNYLQDSLYDIGYMPLELKMPHPAVSTSMNPALIAQYQQNTNCCIFLNDTIFQYQQNKLIPRIVIPAFQQQVINIRSIKTQNGSELTNALRQLCQKGIYLVNIHETEDYFFIGYPFQEIIWNKKQKKGILFSTPEYYGYDYTPKALNITDILDKENDDPLYNTPQLKQLKPHLKEDDNPVIAIYHLKPMVNF